VNDAVVERMSVWSAAIPSERLWAISWMRPSRRARSC
jgi:hypothetical protein